MKKNRLIQALEMINSCRGVYNTKRHIRENSETPKKCAIEFNRTLHDLTDMGINPVTIPREWGYRSLPNLLERFFMLYNLQLEDVDVEFADGNIEEVEPAGEGDIEYDS
jgi:hypothetical protein